MKKNQITITNQSSKLALNKSKKLLNMTKQILERKTEYYIKSKQFDASRKHINLITSLSITPDGNYIVSGSLDFTIKVWNIKTGECLRTLEFDDDYTIERHSYDRMANVVSTYNNGYIISQSDYNTVQVFDMEKSKCIKRFEYDSNIDFVDISPNGDSIYTVNSDNNIQTWDVINGNPISTIICEDNSWQTIEYFNIAKDFMITVKYTSGLTGYFMCEVNTFNISNGNLMRTFIPQSEYHDYLNLTRNDFKSSKVSKDGQYLVSKHEDSKLRLWVIASGKCKNSIVFGLNEQQYFEDSHYKTHFESSLVDFEISPKSNYILTVNKSGNICIWDIETLNELHSLDVAYKYTDISYYIINYDETRIVTILKNGEIKLWDIISGECLITTNGDPDITTVVINDRGDTIVYGKIDGSINTINFAKSQ